MGQESHSCNRGEGGWREILADGAPLTCRWVMHKWASGLLASMRSAARPKAALAASIASEEETDLSCVGQSIACGRREGKRTQAGRLCPFFPLHSTAPRFLTCTIEHAEQKEMAPGMLSV